MKQVAILSVLVGGCLLLAGDLAEPADTQPNEDAVKAFMRAKLDAAQDVLEGLVTEDYEKVEQGAQRMRVMSARAEWNVIKTPTYDQYSNEFRHAAKRLEKAARNENLDEAALTYVSITVTCVNCHKHARGAKIAGLSLPKRFRDRALDAMSAVPVKHDGRPAVAEAAFALPDTHGKRDQR